MDWSKPLLFAALALTPALGTLAQCPHQPLGAEFSPLMVQDVSFPNPQTFAGWKDCSGLARVASYRALKGRGSQADRLALLTNLPPQVPEDSAVAYARGTLEGDEEALAWAAISGKSYAPWAALEWARVALEKGDGERALQILERGVEVGSSESLRPLMALRNRLRTFYGEQDFTSRKTVPLVSTNRTRRALDGLLLGMGPWQAVDSRSGLLYQLADDGQLSKPGDAPAWYGQAFSGESLWGGTDGSIRVGRHSLLQGPRLGEQSGTYQLVLDGLGGWWSRSRKGVLFSDPGGGGQDLALRSVVALAPARSGVWAAVDRGRDLVRLDHQGREVARIPASAGGWRKIEVLATDPLGLLYVADAGGTIYWGLPDGSRWRQLAHGGRRPGAITAGVEDILISDSKDYILTHLKDLP